MTTTRPPAGPTTSATSGGTRVVLPVPGGAVTTAEEDGLLFSGDHILSGSTTVIDAPDGDMTVYLASLDKLAAACAAYGANFILPAHGHVLHEAQQAIVRLKAHRLAREAKVLAAMRQRPSGTLDDWLPLAYADVPPEAHYSDRKSVV